MHEPYDNRRDHDRDAHQEKSMTVVLMWLIGSVSLAAASGILVNFIYTNDGHNLVAALVTTATFETAIFAGIARLVKHLHLP